MLCLVWKIKKKSNFIKHLINPRQIKQNKAYQMTALIVDYLKLKKHFDSKLTAGREYFVDVVSRGSC